MDVKAFLDTSRWNIQEYAPQQVIERVWPSIARLNPSLLTELDGADITDFHDVRKPEFEASLLAFSADKIQKLVIGNMHFVKQLTVFFVTIYPADGYDVPVVGTDLVERVNQVRLLLDLHALADIVVTPEYREKYLDPLEPTWNKYLDLQTETVPAGWYRSLLSTIAITGRQTFEPGDRSKAARALDCLSEYLDYYVNQLVLNAQPVADVSARQYAITRREGIKTIYRTRDLALERVAISRGTEAAQKWGRIVY